MDSIQLHILSPEGTLVNTMAESVALPGMVSPFVVLKGHAPLVSALVKGDIVYRSNGEEFRQSIREGFVSVGNNIVTVCAEV